jgi:hypothetical protein
MLGTPQIFELILTQVTKPDILGQMFVDQPVAELGEKRLTSVSEVSEFSATVDS